MGLTIAITGSSSTMGQLLIEELLDRDDVTSIRGLDLVPTSISDHRFQFIQGDVRTAVDVEKLVKGADIVIHMAFLVFVYPKNAKHRRNIDEINVLGSKNVFQVCAAQSITKIIYASSVAAYGFKFGRNVLTQPLREDEPLDGETNGNFYLENKKEVELFLDTFQEDHPQIVISRLRPHVIAGPKYLELVNLKLYKDGLSGRIYTRVRQPRSDAPPVEQLVHEKDVVKALLYCIDHDLNGAINVAGDPLELSPYLESKSIRLVQVPRWLARTVLKFKKWFSETAKLEYYWTNAMIYPVIVSNANYKELIGEPVSTEKIFDEIHNYLLSQ